MFGFIPITMFKCLILTILFELLLAFIIGIRNKKDLFNVILVNCLTNPILVSIVSSSYLIFGLKVKTIVELLLEIIVIIIEGLIYKKYLNYKKINQFMISFILNISSYSIGLLLNYFLGGL